ncbi:hypothetical protein D4R89_01065 [bacterium]|nr:MAG: hypothetical protein D4R89_01065 [bacterium]
MTISFGKGRINMKIRQSEWRCCFVLMIMACIFLMNEPVYAGEDEIAGICQKLAENIVNAGKKTIAVVDFTDLQGNVTELGRFFAEEYSVGLATTGKAFDVIDRTHLKAILAEHKLAATGIIDPQTARQLGQIAGVDALITGTITPFGDTVRLSVKVLDTNTARILGASAADIAKTKTIEELLAKGIGEKSSSPNTMSGSSAIRKTGIGASVIKTEVNDFTFELKQCKISGTTIICEVLIINNEKDRQVVVYGRGYSNYSRIIDNNGFEYKAEKFQLGSNSNQGGGYVSGTMVTGIPTLLIFKFENISEPPESIGLLDICCEVDSTSFRGQLRNIPIIK